MRRSAAGLLVLGCCAWTPAAARADGFCEPVPNGPLSASAADAFVPLTDSGATRGSFVAFGAGHPPRSVVPANIVPATPAPPEAPGIGPDPRTMPSVSTTGTTPLAAWVDSAANIEVARLGPDGTLGPPATVSSGSATGVLAGVANVFWTAADGDHLVRVTAGVPAGDSIAVGDTGAQRLAADDDSTGTAWLLLKTGGALSVRRVPPAGALPPPTALSGLAPGGTLRLAADGRGGAFVLDSSANNVNRLVVVHIARSGIASRPVTVAARVQMTDDPSSFGRLAARDGAALVAYSLAGAGGRANPYVRTISASGRLSAPRNLSPDRHTDTWVTDLKNLGQGRGLLGLVAQSAHKPGYDSAAPSRAMVLMFGARGPGRTVTASTSRGDSVASVVVAPLGGGAAAVWGRSAQSDDSDSSVLGRVVLTHAGPIMKIADAYCQSV